MLWHYSMATQDAPIVGIKVKELIRVLYTKNARFVLPSEQVQHVGHSTAIPHVKYARKGKLRVTKIWILWIRLTSQSFIALMHLT